MLMLPMTTSIHPSIQKKKKSSSSSLWLSWDLNENHSNQKILIITWVISNKQTNNNNNKIIIWFYGGVDHYNNIFVSQFISVIDTYDYDWWWLVIGDWKFDINSFLHSFQHDSFIHHRWHQQQQQNENKIHFSMNEWNIYARWWTTDWRTLIINPITNRKLDIHIRP